ncbi:MAG TPA: GMC family oxidoreductase, partial [Pseudomonadales bacterium]|nr:GMC family oxidoreductase [Pseudomonadales bacterium]
VDKIVPLNEQGLEDANATGEFGYHVHMVDLANKATLVVNTKRVIVAAGVFGSTNILLRNKTLHKTLKNVSAKLGQKFSGNGDFFNFVLFTQKPTGGGTGPTIVDYIDYNASNDPKGYIAEPMSLPFAALSNLAQVLKPSKAFQDFVTNLLNATGDHVLTHFTIGPDSSDGTMSLARLTKGLRLKWPQNHNYGLYNKMIAGAVRAKRSLQGLLATYLPTWATPLQRNLTVHPLGGCTMADSPLTGVVSAKRGELGQVFNYKNLYVADGSIIPSAIGVNPVLTIGSIAEMIAEDITGIEPTIVL